MSAIANATVAAEPALDDERVLLAEVPLLVADPVGDARRYRGRHYGGLVAILTFVAVGLLAYDGWLLLVR